MTAQKFGIDKTAIDTTAKHTLGALHIDEDGNHYRYMQADGTVEAYKPYSFIAGTWQIDELIDVGVNPATAESVPLCVWDGSSTSITDNYFAWVFVGPGLFTATTAGDVAANAIVYGHATAGLVDDAAVALLLDGVSAPAAITGATTGTFYAAKPLHGLDLQ